MKIPGKFYSARSRLFDSVLGDDLMFLNQIEGENSRVLQSFNKRVLHKNFQ
jgi:hypothetical protein